MKKRLIAWTVAAAMMAAASSAAAQSSLGWGNSPQLLDEYVAYIGVRDLRASDGVRLSQAWQIIRQDRANYHRFGVRDRGDESDSFFGSANNRAIMERMVRDGRMSPSAARAVVQGDVWVSVRIYGRGSVGQYVEVTVN